MVRYRGPVSARMGAGRRAAAATSLLLAMLALSHAHAAPTTSDKAAAQVLFDEARALAKQGQWDNDQQSVGKYSRDHVLPCSCRGIS